MMQEIAIRVFRTAHELAMHTVAIYSYEDRMSAHRQKVFRLWVLFISEEADRYISRPMKRIRLARD